MTTTSTPLTVYASDENALTTAEIIASLPVSLRHAEAASTADVREINGADGWVARTRNLLDDGPRAVIVTDPTAADPADVEALHRQLAGSGTSIYLAERFASNPTVQEFRTDNRDAMDGLAAVFTTVSASASDTDRTVAQLRVLRALGFTDVRLQSRFVGVVGLTLAGTIGDAKYGGLGTSSAALPVGLSVRGYAADRTIEIDLPDVDTARPASATITNAAGSVVLPTLWETGYRATWRRMHRALTSSYATDGDDLLTFAADIRTATS